MDANAVLLSFKDKIPDSSLVLVQDKLKNASEEKLNALMILPLKSAVIGLALGVTFGNFGVDRFYKGDIGLGITKLAMIILGYVMLVISAVFIDDSSAFGLRSDFMAMLLVAFLLMIAVWIWTIVDFFLVYKGIKEDNLSKVLAVLG